MTHYAALIAMVVTLAPAAPQTPRPAAPAAPATAPAPAAAPAPAPAPAPAQAPAPGQPSPAQQAPAAASPAKPPESEPYSYQPEGRRDPFVSLLGTGGDTRIVSRHGDGPASLAVADISVRGVMHANGALIAMVQAPDNKTYIVHQGDKLLDGTIKSVTPQGLIILQDVNDPLSLVKQREVARLLRSAEGARP